tara:strand:- start:245 stop:484 length:240 start_codon:yes stop_codon:yes gene_type:complete
MSAVAIPAVATNAVEAISSFFILKFLIELFIYGPPLENPVSNKTFDDFPVTGQEFQSQFTIDYYDWCKLVTPLVVSVFS